jgi:serine/threonine protein kinase
MYDQCGTPAYIAPEILKGNGYEGPPVDFWSAGVVLYAMLSGTVPFKAKDMVELHNIISKGEFNEIEGVSKEVNNLLHGILEVDSKKRFGAEEILGHPWMFTGEDNGTILNSKFYKIFFLKFKLFNN